MFPPAREEVFNIDFLVASPLDNGIMIDVPDVRFSFIKEAALIGKKNIFNNSFSSDEKLKVVSSPDFGQSGILIAETTGQDRMVKIL